MRKITYNKRDGNEKEIVEALTADGWSVQPIMHPTDKGVPDLIAAKFGKTIAVEIKVGDRKLETEQDDWRRWWQGQYIIARSPSQAVHLCQLFLQSKLPSPQRQAELKFP